MASRYVLPILLATVCSLLPLTAATAPLPGLSGAISFTSSSMETLIIADKYSLRNTYLVHSGCAIWCWPMINKVAREECRKNKKIRCEQKKNFSYRAFIVFHLSKFGMGKLASSALGVPDAVVKAGIQAGTATFSTVGTGAKAVVGGVGTGTETVAKGVASGAKGATKMIGTGTEKVGEGVATAASALSAGKAKLGGGLASLGKTPSFLKSE